MVNALLFVIIAIFGIFIGMITYILVDVKEDLKSIKKRLCLIENDIRLAKTDDEEVYKGIKTHANIPTVLLKLERISEEIDQVYTAVDDVADMVELNAQYEDLNNVDLALTDLIEQRTTDIIDTVTAMSHLINPMVTFSGQTNSNTVPRVVVDDTINTTVKDE